MDLKNLISSTKTIKVEHPELEGSSLNYNTYQGKS